MKGRMRCTGVCHGRSFLKKYQLKATRGVAADTAKTNTAVEDKLKPEQIESSCWRVSLFESRACQNTLGDVDSRRLSHLGQGKEQAKPSGPRRDQSGEQRQGSSLSRELVADGIWHPSGPGCARFGSLEACDEYSGHWSHQYCGSIKRVGEGSRGI